MTEGAVADWSAVFLRGEFSRSTAEAGIGYSVFALMVALGRFFGDALKRRFGPVNLARGAGGLAVAGMLVLVLGDSFYVALLGFGLIGIGVSVGFPLAVTAAAGQPDRPAAASVAILSFIALLGFLVGPPLIGLVAQLTGLRFGLATLVPPLVLSLLLTGMLRVRRV
jgi:MFS family permease